MRLFLHFVESAGVCAVVVFFIAYGLSLLGRAGAIGKSLVDTFAKAPVLDFWVALLTWVPWVAAVVCVGWIGLPGALLGQMIALYGWCWWHEKVHADAAKGPRIIKFLNRSVGRWQNHLALWVTLVAVPGFWMIRVTEVFAYYPLMWLLNFPKYKQSEWINVSRFKFDGLVGHDLVWCLYCDWMTGVYSLGAEMLRNVESFWCPIRFYEGKKCDNCKVDFPDIASGWVRADGSMAEVEQTMEAQYGAGQRGWFGHPARLTVKGQEVNQPPS